MTTELENLITRIEKASAKFERQKQIMRSQCKWLDKQFTSMSKDRTDNDD